MGAKSKLTDEVREKVCKAIAGGNYAPVAAKAAGISESTFYSWLKQGEEAKSGKYLVFLESVKSAEAFAETSAVQVVQDAMPSDWKAAMTYLERRYPERWRRRETQEITGKDGSPLTIKVVYDE